MLSSNIADRLFVHFPVPWDKKPHRRVISPQFLTGGNEGSKSWW